VSYGVRWSDYATADHYFSIVPSNVGELLSLNTSLVSLFF
jgi:hypothetical protein